MDLYTVNIEEIDNYKSLLTLNPLEAGDLYDEVQINDEVLKSLMTEAAYESLLRNRENLKFTEICYRKNYTMDVSQIQLREHKTEADKAAYDFEAQIKLISNDGREIVSEARGALDLVKTEKAWKISGYRYILPDILR